MIEYTLRYASIPTSQVIWFNDNPDFFPKSNFLYTLRQSVSLNSAQKYIVNETVFSTNIIDLTQGVDDIWEGFDKKSTQYEIRKAQKYLSDIEVETTDDSKKIREFLTIGEDFYLSKYKKRKKYTLDNVLSKKNFLLFIGKYKGEFICGHLFIFDPERVRLNYSFSSAFLGEENKTISGFLAKYLHFEAMKYFKEHGYKKYDFGGINLDKSLPTYGITQFKLSFGGEIVTEKDYLLSKHAPLINKVVKNSIVRKLASKIPFFQRFLYG